MDVNLIWLFLYTSVYNTGLANGVKIRTTIFRVSRKHQDLRKCAMEIQNNDNIAGGRVSYRTGKCEKLTGEHQTLEPGYGYVEKGFFKAEFQPAVSADALDKGRIINFPGPPTAGSRIDLNFIRTSPALYAIEFFKEEGADNENFTSFFIDVFEMRDTLMAGSHNNNISSIHYDLKTMCPSDECKFSFVFQDGHIQVLANDRITDAAVYFVKSTNIRQIKRVSIRGYNCVISSLVFEK